VIGVVMFCCFVGTVFTCLIFSTGPRETDPTVLAHSKVMYTIKLASGSKGKDLLRDRSTVKLLRTLNNLRKRLGGIDVSEASTEYQECFAEMLKALDRYVEEVDREYHGEGERTTGVLVWSGYLLKLDEIAIKYRKFPEEDESGTQPFFVIE